MLYKDIGKRASGKSTRLLQAAITNHANIAVYDASAVEIFTVIAYDVLHIPFNQIKHTYYGVIICDVLVAPLVYYFNPKNMHNGKKLYIDELDLCLTRVLPLAGYTLSEEEKE